MAASGRLDSIAMQLASAMRMNEAGDNDEHQRTTTNTTITMMKELAAASFTPEESNEIVHRAMAVLSASCQTMNDNETTITTAVTAPAFSFSLLDQFASLSERVMWNDIEAATNDEHRLQLLQKVDHIDDILGDWKELQAMLKQGLSKLKESYLDLHMKWYNQCQATSEYQKIRLDLCSNILNSIDNFQECFKPGDLNLNLESTITKEHEICFRMIQTWRIMWIKIIRSGAYREEHVDRMLHMPLSWVNDQPVIGTMLALVDPKAIWLECWLNDAPVHRVISSLGKSRRLLPKLRRRLESSITSPDMTTKVQECVHQHLVTILKLLVIHLRVRMFPWQWMFSSETQMSSPTSESSNETPAIIEFPSPQSYSSDQLLFIATVFLSKEDDDCAGALEALLLGCSKEQYHMLKDLVSESRVSGNLLIKQAMESRGV